MNNNSHFDLYIQSPLVIDGRELILSEPDLKLESGKNLMIHCETQESGIALIRAILGLERVTIGSIRIKTAKKEILINKKNNPDFSEEDIRLAYVSKDGSDFCRELTIKENLNLIENNPDYNERIRKLSADFLVEENLDDFPDTISVKRNKIFSIIRAWAYLPDIIVYSNPLEHLDDINRVELLRSFAIPKLDSKWLSVIYTPSIGEFSNVLHNFHLVEISH